MIDASVRGKFHLAGIIPVAGQKLDFDMPWHDSMMPIAKNYLAIENAIIQCTYAGCETIWLVLSDDIKPVIRERIGDYVEDPLYITNRWKKWPSQHAKRIPVYYILIHPHDRDRRDCFAWSALYGAEIADQIIRAMSRHLVPDKYFVSFPYGIVPGENLHTARAQISSDNNVCFSYKGKTMKNNAYLPFTFGIEDSRAISKRVKARGTGMYFDYAWFDLKEKLPLEERYSARFFDLEEVFTAFEPDETIEVDWFYEVGDWDSYCHYIAEGQEKIRRPYKRHISGQTVNPIGEEESD